MFLVELSSLGSCLSGYDCVRDRSPKGREGRLSTELGPLGGKIAA